MSDQVLFVYGSLLSPEVLKLVIGRVAVVELAVLGLAQHFRRSFKRLAR